VLPSVTAVAWSVGGWQVSRSDGYGRSYDWSKDVPAIKAPTLLVFGYADAVRTAHAIKFFELLGGGKKDGGWDGSWLLTIIGSAHRTGSPTQRRRPLLGVRRERVDTSDTNDSNLKR
jgi:pimeloyl-ACP methyl ester carboxylesterase